MVLVFHGKFLIFFFNNISYFVVSCSVFYPIFSCYIGVGLVITSIIKDMFQPKQLEMMCLLL